MKHFKCLALFNILLVVGGGICLAQRNEVMKEVFVPNKYGIMKIIGKYAPLYELPKPGARKLTNVPLNTIVRRSGECDKWCQIVMYNEGPSGWIDSKLLEDCPAAESDGAIIPPSVSIINPIDDTVEVNFLKTPPVDWRYFKYHDKYFQVIRDSFTLVAGTKDSHSLINREYALLISGLDKIYLNKGEILSVRASDFGAVNVVSLSSTTNMPGLDCMALSSNDLVFVTSRNYNKSAVYIIDPKTDKLINVIPSLPAMWGIATSPNGKVYITCPWADQIIVIDATKQEVEKMIEIHGAPEKILFDNNKIYVTTSRDDVVVLDANNYGILKRINVGPAPQDIWLAEDGRIYVWNTASYYSD
ncbi:MAG: hypothetical protein M0033_06950 [Nitrospiraceae bacterium]|nr:hypothetical protein [Elusimicrobiota bacterium]MDA8325941.1 hypothetical protein [Nitrospiraceae bacterium]